MLPFRIGLGSPARLGTPSHLSPRGDPPVSSLLWEFFGMGMWSWRFLSYGEERTTRDDR